jgi:HAMP domain-containing protein
MSKTTKSLNKQAAAAQLVARRMPDAFRSDEMTALAMAFRAQADVLKRKRKRKQ